MAKLKRYADFVRQTIKKGGRTSTFAIASGELPLLKIYAFILYWSRLVAHTSYDIDFLCARYREISVARAVARQFQSGDTEFEMYHETAANLVRFIETATVMVHSTQPMPNAPSESPIHYGCVMYRRRGHPFSHRRIDRHVVVGLALDHGVRT